MIRRSIVIVVAAVFIWALATVTMAADDPFVGTWKLNLERSRTVDAPSKSYTLKIDSHGKGEKWILDVVQADGSALHREFNFKYGDKTNPAVEEQNLVAVIIDANNRDYMGIRDGKPISISHTAISNDGKTMTRMAMRHNSVGQDVTDILVFDKQ